MVCDAGRGYPARPVAAVLSLSPKRIWRAGERERVRGGYLLECRQELGSWRWALACEQAVAPHPRPAKPPASLLSPEGAGERGTVATFPSPPSAFGARGERVRVRGGYWLQGWLNVVGRAGLAREQAAAPHPRPAKIAGLCPLPRRGGGEGNRAYLLPIHSV